MIRLICSLALLFLCAGCTSVPPRNADSAAVGANSADNSAIVAFSTGIAGNLPLQWRPLVIFRTKKPTEYRLVPEQGISVLHAYANEASSGLMQHVNLDPLTQPWLHWKWKIGRSVNTLDQQKKATEDSPARVILGFDGDKEVLPFADQIMFETAKIFTGHDFPYATLMYVWDRHTPIGTIMPSYRSGRIKMIVVANEEAGIGTWQIFHRNIVDDFKAAFGERPGQLIGVGVLTDTDNLGETVEAWYGDIGLRHERQ